MRCLLLLVALVTFGCRADDAIAPTIDAPPDGVDGTGCTTMTPRTVPLEAFVGPTGLQDRLAGCIDSAQHIARRADVSVLGDRPRDSTSSRRGMRGVAVRVILDPGEAGNDARRIRCSTTAACRGRTRRAVYSYSHAKYLIIDRTTDGDHVDELQRRRDDEGAQLRLSSIAIPKTSPTSRRSSRGLGARDSSKNAPVADLTCTRLIVSPVNSNPAHARADRQRADHARCRGALHHRCGDPEPRSPPRTIAASRCA